MLLDSFSKVQEGQQNAAEKRENHTVHLKNKVTTDQSQHQNLSPSIFQSVNRGGYYSLNTFSSLSAERLDWLSH